MLYGVCVGAGTERYHSHRENKRAPREAQSEFAPTNARLLLRCTIPQDSIEFVERCHRVEAGAQRLHHMSPKENTKFSINIFQYGII